MRPSTNLTILRARHDAIHHFLQAEGGTEALHQLNSNELKRVRDVPNVISRIQMVRSSLSDWKNLSKTQNV